MDLEGVEGARRTFRDLPVTHVATVDGDGAPHVVPLWFVWREDAVYVSLSRASRTWRNAGIDARVSLSFDVWREWVELVGAVVEGRAETLPAGDPAVRGAMSSWHDKYRTFLAGEGFSRFAARTPDLGFLRVVPGALSAWDHAGE